MYDDEIGKREEMRKRPRKKRNSNLRGFVYERGREGGFEGLLLD